MSVKNNKIYRDVLIECEKAREPSKYMMRYNTLVKLLYSTEDVKLQQYLKAYTGYCPLIEKYAKARQITLLQEQLMNAKMLKSQIVSYCQEVLSSGEPEWVVCARAAGWVPGR